MGRRPSKAPHPKESSTAETLTSILENWVSQEEEEGRKEERALQELIQRQTEQVREKKGGLKGQKSIESDAWGGVTVYTVLWLS